VDSKGECQCIRQRRRVGEYGDPQVSIREECNQGGEAGGAAGMADYAQTAVLAAQPAEPIMRH
jgi:hypothetical protein